MDLYLWGTCKLRCALQEKGGKGWRMGEVQGLLVPKEAIGKVPEHCDCLPPVEKHDAMALSFAVISLKARRWHSLALPGAITIGYFTHFFLLEHGTARQGSQSSFLWVLHYNALVKIITDLLWQHVLGAKGRHRRG